MRISDWSSDVCSSDLLEPGAIDRGDIARFIETDAQNLLVDRARPREGELARFARDIIIFVRAELTDEGRTAERLFDRLAIIAAGRSAEGRGGKECVSKCRSRGSAEH